MKALTRFLLSMVVLALFGCIGVMLFAQAHAQVTDKPILRLPNLSEVVADFDMTEKKGCAIWWERDQDPFGDWHLAKAFCEGDGCYALSTDLTKMVVARTRNVTPDDVSRCVAKLTYVPPPVWIVAPYSTGERPVFELDQDNKRKASTAKVSVTMAPEGHPELPRWCNCKVRSVEITSSTYCVFAGSKQTFNPTEPVRVTLCRKG